MCEECNKLGKDAEKEVTELFGLTVEEITKIRNDVKSLCVDGSSIAKVFQTFKTKYSDSKQREYAILILGLESGEILGRMAEGLKMKKLIENKLKDLDFVINEKTKQDGMFG